MGACQPRLLGKGTQGCNPGRETLGICYTQVEMISRTQLTLERDACVGNHVFNGTALLATVFGLEAMPQAAWAAAGDARLRIIGVQCALMTGLQIEGFLILQEFVNCAAHSPCVGRHHHLSGSTQPTTASASQACHDNWHAHTSRS